MSAGRYRYGALAALSAWSAEAASARLLPQPVGVPPLTATVVVPDGAGGFAIVARRPALAIPAKPPRRPVTVGANVHLDRAIVDAASLPPEQRP
ncbi:hypothetical protein [Flavisphingomonas formosensis]|uniref:hypothetical protein n=1 Tax=Flavisphingomonas formosensis TaxID=861534 RepID=UPI0012FCF6B0|nr:hypothetical protein [Sphingomonas formosensis]